MILCPFHGETKPSMRIYPDHYYCFGCGAWGDHVDWLVQVEGLEYDQALDIVDNWDGPVVPRSQTRDAEDDARRTAYALKWWDAAKPIPGTLAARYLAEIRGIDLDALPDNINDAPALPPALRVRSRHPASLPAGADAQPDQRRADRDPAHRADPGRPEDRPHDARPRRRGAAVAGRQAARDRRGAGDDARRRHQARPIAANRLRPAWATLSDGGMGDFPSSTASSG